MAFRVDGGVENLQARVTYGVGQPGGSMQHKMRLRSGWQGRRDDGMLACVRHLTLGGSDGYDSGTRNMKTKVPPA